MNDLSDLELGWLVGILEGEGCFSFSKTQKGFWRFEVSVNMTDEDVIYALPRITGLGNIYGPQRKKKEHWKPSWKWAVVKEEDVKDLCVRVKPHMHGRRRVQIHRLLTTLYYKRWNREAPKLVYYAPKYNRTNPYKVKVKGNHIGCYATEEAAIFARDRELQRLGGKAS